MDGWRNKQNKKEFRFSVLASLFVLIIGFLRLEHINVRAIMMTVVVPVNALAYLNLRDLKFTAQLLANYRVLRNNFSAFHRVRRLRGFSPLYTLRASLKPSCVRTTTAESQIRAARGNKKHLKSSNFKKKRRREILNEESRKKAFVKQT